MELNLKKVFKGKTLYEIQKKKQKWFDNYGGVVIIVNERIEHCILSNKLKLIVEYF